MEGEYPESCTLWVELSTVLEKSSEVISDEDLKHKIDQLNLCNKDWKPEAEVEYPIGESSEMSDQLREAPGQCGCKDCLEGQHSSGDEERREVHSSDGVKIKSTARGREVKVKFKMMQVKDSSHLQSRKEETEIKRC